jgi:hypothetical protein
MNSTNPITPSPTLSSPEVTAMLAELRSSNSISFKLYWRASLLAALYGMIAWLQGPQFFMLYCGTMVVVLTFHDISRRRTQVQVDLILELLREQQKIQHDDSPAA